MNEIINDIKSKRYSLWSNFKWAYGPVWREKREYIWDSIIIIIMSVLIPLIGSSLTALVVWLLGNNMTPATIIAAIATAFIVYGGINGIRSYMDSKHDAHNIEVRLDLFMMQILEQEMQLPLEYAENADVKLMDEKAGMAIGNNVGGIEGFFRWSGKLMAGLLGLIVYSIIAGTIHPLILAMLLGLSVLAALVDNLPSWYYRRIKDDLAKNYVTMRYVDNVMDDIPAGKDIRIFNLRPWIISKYDAAINNSRRLNAGKDMLAFIGSFAVVGANALRDLVCYIYLINQMRHGMTIAEMVFYLGIIGGFAQWFNEVSRNIVLVSNCHKEIGDIRRYLDIPTDDGMRTVPDNEFQHIEVEFCNVSYQYNGAEHEILKDVSFKINAGEHLALVGVNGAGKSTIVKLMSGLYMPTKGQVLINGVSTREMHKIKYFEHEAVVFQDAFITSYTIGENVGMCENYNRSRVMECIDRAGLTDKINALPDGIDTYLGKDVTDSGIMLSGGEIQRMLLARALYRNPKLIMLDEPTAALDAIAESKIYEIYNDTLRDITSIFISHRLASTRFCDDIILLEEGVIKEQGTHDELMNLNGRYYELFKIQSKYYEDGDSQMGTDTIQRGTGNEY